MLWLITGLPGGNASSPRQPELSEMELGEHGAHAWTQLPQQTYIGHKTF